VRYLLGDLHAAPLVVRSYIPKSSASAYDRSERFTGECFRDARFHTAIYRDCDEYYEFVGDVDRERNGRRKFRRRNNFHGRTIHSAANSSPTRDGYRASDKPS